MPEPVLLPLLPTAGNGSPPEHGAEDKIRCFPACWSRINALLLHGELLLSIISYCPPPLQSNASAKTWALASQRAKLAQRHLQQDTSRERSSSQPEDTNCRFKQLAFPKKKTLYSSLLRPTGPVPLCIGCLLAALHRAGRASPPKAKVFSQHHPRICRPRMLWQGKVKRAPRPRGSLQGEGSSKLPQHTGTEEETSNRKLPADASERGSSRRPLRDLQQLLGSETCARGLQAHIPPP